MEMNREPLDTPNPKYVQRVEKHVRKKSNRMKYKVVVDDPHRSIQKTWHTAAGLSGIPAVILIDKQGRIAYIGRYNQKFLDLVDDVINDKHSMEDLIKIAREEEAKTTPYEPDKPLLIDGNGGADTVFEFRSLIAKFKGDIKTGGSEFITGNRKMVQEIGCSLFRLYKLAYSDTTLHYPMGRINCYGKYWREPILEVKDSIPFQYSYKKPDNRWNYSLIVPEKLSAGELQKIMQRDLKNYFGYQVSVENRKMPCWVLTATRSAKKNLPAKTPGKEHKVTNLKEGTLVTNANIKGIIYSLWRSNQFEPPFLDETGIEGEIDLLFKTKGKELEHMIEAYKELGIIIKKAKRKMKVVVIRDAEK